MTHDFARQRATRATRAAKPAPSSWLVFLSGVITGTLGSFLVYLATLAPHPLAPASAPSIGLPAEPAIGKPAEAMGKPQFDFYTILPESEVIVGEHPPTTSKSVPPSPRKDAAGKTAPTSGQPATDTAPAAAVEPAKPNPADTPEPPSLVLQAGSFRHLAEADHRRASIILLGYPARVETVNVRGGETWYRVQVGPFADARALSEARGALHDQGIESVEIGMLA